MKKKVRVRQRVSKVRVLRNEKTLPQRKMYTPRVKLCGCTWVFTIGDPDDKPSVPHAHAVDSGYRLDAWTGDIYPAGTERMQKIGKLKEKELHRLHSCLLYTSTLARTLLALVRPEQSCPLPAHGV